MDSNQSNMIRKKIPDEILKVLDNGFKYNHRSFIVMVGSKATDQIHNFYKLIEQRNTNKKASDSKVLWCYKNKLNISSNREKRVKELKKYSEKGILDTDLASDIDLFLNSKNVRFTKYSTSSSVLGQTFDMLVLQDFEAITPNILARTVETVAGGGVIMLLLETMKTLEDLYSVTMGYHKNMSREVFGKTMKNFNRRFMKSIQEMKNCVVIDDEYNLLEEVKSLSVSEVGKFDQKELQEVKDNVANNEKVGPIIAEALTLDQARTVLHVIDIIGEKQLNKVIGITAARGRGKSAAIGLSLASAIAHDYSNIFVTAPKPSNLQMVFEFAIKGLNALGYKKDLDYFVDLVTRNTIDGQKSRESQSYITSIRVNKTHHQSIVYIPPNQHELLGQCEILAIDEAAAIPLPIVRKLMGPYITLFSSTVDGYEGTGRALSLKLFEEFKKTMGSRFTKISLSSPIRYSEFDPIEKWLHSLLLLDVHPKDPATLPNPNDCQLVSINRQVLFSGSPKVEPFLASLVSLSVASHYKNTPDDLLLMADSPNHQLFALIPPLEGRSLPDVICYLQIALEGRIAKEHYEETENRSGKKDGDLIPWNMSHQFNAPEFASKTGIRVIRIAVHPMMQGKGYGQYAIEQLLAFYKGQIPYNPVPGSENSLLNSMSSSNHESIDYAGVSFGLTRELNRFWKRAGFQPVYISAEPNDVTGEHSTIVLQPMNDDNDWMNHFNSEFRRRFLRLLGSTFKSLSPFLCEDLLFPMDNNENPPDYHIFFSDTDIYKLSHWREEGISGIMDLLPVLANYLFIHKAPIKLNRTQMMLVLMLGLQLLSPQECKERLQIQINQVYSFTKTALAKFLEYFRGSDNTQQSLKQKDTSTPDI